MSRHVEASIVYPIYYSGVVPDQIKTKDDLENFLLDFASKTIEESTVKAGIIELECDETEFPEE